MIRVSGRASATWYKKQVDAGVQQESERGLYFCVCVNYVSSVGDTNYQTGFIFQALRDDGEALLHIDCSLWSKAAARIDRRLRRSSLKDGEGGQEVQ